MAFAGCTVTSNRFWTVRFVIFPYSTTWAIDLPVGVGDAPHLVRHRRPEGGQGGPGQLVGRPTARPRRARPLDHRGRIHREPAEDRRRLGLRPLEEGRDRRRRDHPGRAQAVQDQQRVRVVPLDRGQRRHVPRDVHVGRAADHADRDLPGIALDDRGGPSRPGSARCRSGRCRARTPPRTRACARRSPACGSGAWAGG